MSKLTHLPLQVRCEKYPYLDQTVIDFEYGLNSILTDTPELDTSFDEVDAMPFSASLGFLCFVSNISDYSRLQLAPSIK